MSHRHIRLLLVTCGLLLGAGWGTQQAGGQTSFPVRITNAASGTFAYKSGESDTTRSNTTETLVLLPAPLASTLLLSATPKAVIGNGVDTSMIVATVLDSTGFPVPDGALVTFVTSRGQFSNLSDTITVLTTNGTALARLRSVVVSGDTSSAFVEASTLSFSGTALVQGVSIIFYPAAIAGRVASALNGAPVTGAVAIVLNQSGGEVGRDTTGANGNYLVPLNATGVYSLVITTLNEFGDPVRARSTLQLTVPASGGLRPLTPWNAIAGTVIDGASGLAVRQSGIRVSITRMSGASVPGGLVLPAERMTDGRGVFVFDSLAPGSYEIRALHPSYPGLVVVSDTMPGSFLVSSNIGTTGSSPLEVSKTSNKRIAEIGDALSYTVTLHNTTQSQPLRSMMVVDDLPLAFVYARGSTRLDGMPFSEPTISRNRLIWFLPDSVATGETKVLSYRVSLGAGALQSNGINRVYASGRTTAGDSIRSSEASVQVTVRAGVFTDRGIVIGKVFFDHNGNGIQDAREHGIEGVELWMEDGTRIVTGDDGKYSLPEVRAGQHVIRVNELTLPTGARLHARSSEFAGDGTSRFIRLAEGGIARADFLVDPPGQASLGVGFFRTRSPAAGNLHAAYIIRWRDIGNVTKIVLTDTLPTGFSYDHVGMLPGDYTGKNSTPSTRILSLVFPSRPSKAIDTIVVTFHADQITTGTRIRSHAKLVLSYPRSRAAEITGRMISFTPPPMNLASRSSGTTEAASGTTPKGAAATTQPVITSGAPVIDVSAEAGFFPTASGPPVPEEVKFPGPSSAPPATGSPVKLRDAHRAWWLNYLVYYVKGKGYEIQVSSWRTKRKGNHESSRLREKHHNSLVKEGWHEELGLRQRVKVRYFPTRDDARINAYKVSVAELDTLPYGDPYTIVIDYHRGWGYAIQVLKCESQSEADAEAQQFRRAGYHASIQRFTDSDNRVWHKVLVGQYETQLSAVEAAETLKLPQDGADIAKTEASMP